MKLSEFISNAEQVLKEYGDMPVVVPEAGCGCCKGDSYDEALGSLISHEITVWSSTGDEKVNRAWVVD